jgi:hypothetical protein
MLTVIIVCITCVTCVCIASHARITILHKDITETPTAGEGITQEMLDAVLAEVAKDPVPSFEDVISVINKEFGGVDYEG